MPFQRKGLWLLVTIRPPAAPVATMRWLSAGVGAGRSASCTAKPAPASTRAAASANSSERKRVS